MPYPAALAALLAEMPLAPLGPGVPIHSARAALDDAARVADARDPVACRAGLWLAFGFLDESHAISQDLHSREGSYWHALMHRREPDPDNSKYWFRRVGNHPVLELLAEQAPFLGIEFADPFAFVDFAERVRDTGSADEGIARRVQRLEWDLLFGFCYRPHSG